jgi:hypothetical protein
MAGPALGDVRQGLAERAARAAVIDAPKAPDLHAEDDRATRQITQAAPVMTRRDAVRQPGQHAAVPDRRAHKVTRWFVGSI